MHFHLRCRLLGNSKHAHIRNDKGVYSCRPGTAEEVRQRIQLIAAGQGVAGQIQLFPGSVHQLASRLQLRRVKIGWVGAHTELGSAHIHRVCTELDCQFQPFYPLHHAAR